jgi:hypothetical protein
MLSLDPNVRRVLVAERVARLADDARRTPARRHRRWVRQQLPLLAGLQLARRVRRRASHTQAAH